VNAEDLNSCVTGNAARIDAYGWYRVGPDDYLWIGRHLKVHLVLRARLWDVWGYTSLGTHAWARYGSYDTLDSAKQRAGEIVRHYLDSAEQGLGLDGLNDGK
jgi:hypothetical protein